MGDGEPRHVAVVGGGIAGLTAAWALRSGAGPAGPVRVTLLETSDRLGGKLRTAPLGDGRVDVGPDAFVARRPEALALCAELGLDGELVPPGARGAAVWARGRLRTLPDGLALGLPTRLAPLVRSGILDLAGLARASLDLVRPPRPSRSGADGADRSVGEIVRSRLGPQVLARLADPLIGGINAGPASEMSAAAVFPPLLDADRAGGSLFRALRPPPARNGAAAEPAPVFLAPRGGMTRIVDELAGALERDDVDVRTDAPVDTLRPDDGGWSLEVAGATLRADAVILAVPAPVAAALLHPVEESLAGLLGTIDYASVTTVTLRMAEAGVPGPLQGTGFLVPAEQGLLVTGCTFLSVKWPHLQRPGEVLLRVSSGRFGDPRADQLDDDALVARVLDELGAILGVTGPPLETVVTRWTEAFPQYRVGHLELVAAMEKAAAGLPGPLALAGAAYRGVGIPACIASGRLAADLVRGGGR